MQEKLIDGEGAVRAAMNDNNLGCVIYDFQDLGKYAGAEYHTFGDWLSVTYNGGSDEQRPARRKTRFTLTLFS